MYEYPVSFIYWLTQVLWWNPQLQLRQREQVNDCHVSLIFPHLIVNDNQFSTLVLFLKKNLFCVLRSFLPFELEVSLNPTEKAGTNNRGFCLDFAQMLCWLCPDTLLTTPWYFVDYSLILCWQRSATLFVLDLKYLSKLNYSQDYHQLNNFIPPHLHINQE